MQRWPFWVYAELWATIREVFGSPFRDPDARRGIVIGATMFLTTAALLVALKVVVLLAR